MTDERDEALVLAAAEFRDSILADNAFKRDQSPSDSTGMCYAICAPLGSLLAGTDDLLCELVEGSFRGRQHFWLRLPDGRVLDPTIDQFTDRHGPVYLGPETDEYEPKS